jgi:hypothetical protein
VGVETSVGVADKEGVMTKKVGELPAEAGLPTTVFKGCGMEAEGDGVVFEERSGANDTGIIEIRLITAQPIAKRANIPLRAKDRQALATYSRRKRKFAKRRLACNARIPKK